MPFRDAYKVVGELVSYCIDNGKVLETLSIEEYKNANELFEEDIYKEISLENCIEKRKVVGGPAPSTLKKHIEDIMKNM